MTQGKACIIAVNKWDAVEKDSYTMDAMRKKLEEDFSFMSYAPVLFIISARPVSAWINCSRPSTM